MKATGVVRRIDDLGRVVIPKEIRRTLRIREGDSLEIFVNNIGDVILKKYSPIAGLSEFAQQYSDSIYNTVKQDVIIFDRERIVASSGKLRSKVLNKKLSSNLDELIEDRESLVKHNPEEVDICDGVKEKIAYTFAPILSNGDPVGGIIFIKEDKSVSTEESDLLIIKTATTFLGRYLEG